MLISRVARSLPRVAQPPCAAALIRFSSTTTSQSVEPQVASSTAPSQSDQPQAKLQADAKRSTRLAAIKDSKKPKKSKEDYTGTAERRLDVDGKPYTREEFVSRYAGSSQNWFQADGRQFVEMRIAEDGSLYTLQQFREYYGEEQAALAHWRRSRRRADVLTSLVIEQESIADLLHFHRLYRPAFNGINVSSCWHRLGFLASKGDWQRHERLWLGNNEDALTPLREHTFSMIPLLEPRPLVITAHGMAVSGFHDGVWKPVFDGIASAAVPRLQRGEIKSNALASLAWAFARAQHRAPALFAAIADRLCSARKPEAATQRLQSLSVQELVNVAWAFAKAKRGMQGKNGRTSIPSEDWNYKPLFDAIEVQMLPRLSEFTPQGLANTAYAYALMGHSAHDLFDELVRAAELHLERFSPQELSNLVLALAKLGHHVPSFLEAVEEAAIPQLHAFKPQELCYLAYSFTKLEHESAMRLFHGITLELQQRGAHRFRDPRCRTMLLTAFRWSGAKMGIELPPDVQLTAPAPIAKKEMQPWEVRTGFDGSRVPTFN